MKQILRIKAYPGAADPKMHATTHSMEISCAILLAVRIDPSMIMGASH